MKNTSVSLDYIRGYFDGEGCVRGIYATKRRPLNGCGIQISSCDYEILRLIHKRLKKEGIFNAFYGGKEGYQRNQLTTKGELRKRTWMISITRKEDVLKFFKIIGSYSNKHLLRMHVVEHMIAFSYEKDQLYEFRKLATFLLKIKGYGLYKMDKVLHVKPQTCNQYYLRNKRKLSNLSQQELLQLASPATKIKLKSLLSSLPSPE